MSSLSDVKPTSRPKVMDILKDDLGFDIKDWGWAANPTYCYEYSFDGGDYIVINLDWAALKKKRGAIKWILDKSEELRRK